MIFRRYIRTRLYSLHTNPTMNVNILYCKHNDVKFLKDDITFQMCSAVNKIVRWQAVGAQQMRGVWVICLRSREAKSTLLNKHLRIADRDVFLYEENPYEMNRRGPNTERLVFRDFPLWEPNGLILDYIKTLPHVTPTRRYFILKRATSRTTTRLLF